MCLDDYTRVKLASIDDEPGSDYINANYVHVRPNSQLIINFCYYWLLLLVQVFLLLYTLRDDVIPIKVFCLFLFFLGL